MGKQKTHVNIYHGYGHTDDLVVYGHVLKNVPASMLHNSNDPFRNMFQLLRLFFVKPMAGEKVQLHWKGQLFESVTEEDGLFKFEWKSAEHLPAGWHELKVAHVNENNEVISENKGSVFVPHVTQYAFITDIDDTIMISYSATVLKRLKELFVKNARTRSLFLHVAHHYEMLALSNTNAETPNPFFYVSSSEWNLYSYLLEVFRFNGFPEGVFLLSQLKQWYNLLKTGKTKHHAKLLRIMRIITVFPKQQFVLLGDNSQSDPVIYEEIANKYPGKIHAVYLRNIKKVNEEKTRMLLAGLQEKGVHTCLFEHSSDAIEHSQKIGLIAEDVAKEIKDAF